MQLWSEYMTTPAKTLSRAVLWRMNDVRAEAEKRSLTRGNISVFPEGDCVYRQTALWWGSDMWRIMVHGDGVV
jgi:hypothetical protein